MPLDFALTGRDEFLKGGKLASLVTGDSGTGKTHFGSTYPGPFWLVTENKTVTGLGAMGKVFPHVYSTKYADIEAALRVLEAERPKKVTVNGKEFPIQSIIQDSITELGPLIQNKVLEDAGKKDRKMNEDLWGKVADELRTFYRRLVALKSDYHILVIARPVVFQDRKRGANYATPDTIGQFRHSVVGLFDLVFVSSVTLEWENGVPRRKGTLYTYPQDIASGGLHLAANDCTGLLGPSVDNSYPEIEAKIYGSATLPRSE